MLCSRHERLLCEYGEESCFAVDYQSADECDQVYERRTYNFWLRAAWRSVVFLCSRYRVRYTGRQDRQGIRTFCQVG